MGTFGRFTLPHAIGFIFIIAGWLYSIYTVVINREFTMNSLIGLAMILFGAYAPELINGFLGLFSRNKEKKE